MSSVVSNWPPAGKKPWLVIVVQDRILACMFGTNAKLPCRIYYHGLGWEKSLSKELPPFQQIGWPLPIVCVCGQKALGGGEGVVEEPGDEGDGGGGEGDCPQQLNRPRGGKLRGATKSSSGNILRVESKIGGEIQNQTSWQKNTSNEKFEKRNTSI